MNLTTKVLIGVCAVVAVFAGAISYHKAPTLEELRNSTVCIFNDSGHGSGVIIDSNCVLTARHVSDHNDLMIRTIGGDVYGVVKAVKDPNSDLALLYIGQKFDEAPLTLDKTPLKIGDVIIMIGTPYDRAMIGTVLMGHVVNIDQEIPMDDVININVDIIDAHAAPGCSGGPVLDTRGHVRAIETLGNPPLCGCIPVGELDGVGR